MEWLDAHSGAVQGVATIVLVVITAYYAVQTKRQVSAVRSTIEESQRAAVRPMVRPASHGAGECLYSRQLAELELRTDQGPEPVQIENAGPGLGGSIQWEVRTSVSTGGRKPDASVPRDHTYILRLPPGKSAWLWQASRNEPMPVGDYDDLTLWYDDVLGNHYKGVFRRQGPQWIPVEPGERIATRPDLFGVSPL